MTRHGVARPSLDVDLWLDELKGYPDEVFLAEGLKNGFQLIPVGSCFQEAEMDNYHSAINPAVRSKVEETLLEELGIGNYVVLLIVNQLSVHWVLSPNLVRRRLGLFMTVVNQLEKLSMIMLI